MSRLAISKRNAIIDDFHNGIQDPDYEVIPSKTTKGKYTVRKRKAEVVDNTEEPKIEQEEPVDNIQNEDDNDIEVDDQQEGMFNPMAYFQEYQLQVNKLLIEQMKALRINNKYLHKKQAKYKDRQKKLYNVFSDIANRPDTPDTKEEPKDNVVQPIEEEDVVEEPKNVNFFDSKYVNNEPVKVIEYENPPPPIEKPHYQNDYEEQLDNMAGTRIVSSRRNRVKAFI